jgi:hypothetical protein
MSDARKTDGSETLADRPAPPKPELLGKGRYSIYQAPNGDGVISYRPDGDDFDQRQVVPAKLWGMILGVLSGQVKDLNPMELMKMLMGGKK